MKQGYKVQCLGIHRAVEGGMALAERIQIRASLKLDGYLIDSEAMSGEDILLVLSDALFCGQDVVDLLWWIQIEILCALPSLQPRHAHARSIVGIKVKHSEDLLDTILMIDVDRFGRRNVHCLLGLAPYSVPSWIVHIQLLPFRV